MAKVKQRIGVLWVLTLLWWGASAQVYPVRYIASATDSAQLASLSLPSTFQSRFEANAYLAGLLPLLQGKGYLTASIDSMRVDSAQASVDLYLGESYQWGTLRTAQKDASLLEAIHFPTPKGAMDFAAISNWQRRILEHLEETGYPFGKIYLDSIALTPGGVTALLKIEKGPLYKIDSIRTKLAALSYVEEEKPADLTMMATGSILNLYLKAKRSSQINALVGFLPNADPLGINRKLLLTVDANVLLRNALGAGETIGLMWQQLQRGSPRLNLLFEQPYIFRSAFGARFSLDMYKLDSLFLNINMTLGVNYGLGEKQTASVFLQRRSTLVSGIDAARIIQSKQLPAEADVSSLNLGVGYDFNSTDYRFNPRRGVQFGLTATAGTKKLKKNNLILELKDPSDPAFDFERLYDTVKQSSYQFRLHANGAKYFQLGKQTALKLGANAGVFQSPVIFRNEMFQIGGNKLLRGFNEESQFVSQYAVGTAEFRLLTGLNSNFFGFVDGGWGKYPFETVKSHTYISAGAGLSFQPKAGLINVTWAVGRRDDTDFNLRQSKIHIGFVSFF
ncbi:MAG: hypothetical protein EOO14_13320 [Chitinophagaceae bacterium]|nr:MAG: hypothetical protein EOO14_13320 [Chitinophagaceae bacterium]